MTSPRLERMAQSKRTEAEAVSQREAALREQLKEYPFMWCPVCRRAAVAAINARAGQRKEGE